jgi:hypothetical protein
VNIYGSARLAVFFADADADLLREKNIIPWLADFD